MGKKNQDKKDQPTNGKKPIKHESEPKIEEIANPADIKLEHGMDKVAEDVVIDIDDVKQEKTEKTTPIAKKNTKKFRMIIRNLVFDIN